MKRTWFFKEKFYGTEKKGVEGAGNVLKMNGKTIQILN